MIRIAVAGAAGRMGQTLVSACNAHQSFILSHTFEQSGHESIGQPASNAKTSPAIFDSIDGAPFDVLIDFTSPAASLSNLAFCADHGLRAVIGTTGFNESEKQRMAELSERTAVVWAPNMSVGVTICLKLLELAASAFGDDVDIEVIEAHHRHKVDAPSGTALKMGEVLARTLGRDLESHGVFVREGHTGPRKDREIGFSTIRAADVVGEHSVWFAGAKERVEITHKASGREIYANGALRCAEWLVDKPSGLFDMQDVLGLKA
ncbi:MAG TPA: 4-hydroxy-tetrahydrodipicolinate reductase [Gammaproteobacteria bacterium]|nr:4-hydroxy-tetrahydrodipicolinate reductase [Gammaproteobacteria bacterium]|tara:strand:- start:1070 stop:1858 length:789 start_codon:yes stop_codon:yes gene_type:complete